MNVRMDLLQNGDHFLPVRDLRFNILELASAEVLARLGQREEDLDRDAQCAGNGGGSF